MRSTNFFVRRLAIEHGQRDYALLLFLYNSGARATEAAGILIEDLTWDAPAPDR